MPAWLGNLLLLIAVFGAPLAIVVTVHWVLRRRGTPAHYDPPETIDYDKW